MAKIAFCLNFYRTGFGGIETIANYLFPLLSTIESPHSFSVVVVSDDELVYKDVESDIIAQGVDTRLIKFNKPLERRKFDWTNPISSIQYFIKRKIHKRNVKLTNYSMLKSTLEEFDVLIDFTTGTTFYRVFEKLPNKIRIQWWHMSFSKFLELRSDIDIHDHYNAIVGLTNNFVDQFNQHYGEKALPCFAIGNEVDCANVVRLGNVKPDESVEDGKFFCCVARLNNDKDHDTLIRGFKLFSQNHPDIKLYLLGNTNDIIYPVLTNLVNSLQLADKVIFLGRKKNPYSYVKRSIANILSSKNEGFPMVILETMSLSVPIISSDCPDGPLCMIKDRVNGYLFTTGDPTNLCQAMEEAYSNQELNLKLTTNALQTVQGYSNKQAQATINMVNQLVG